MTGAQEQLVSRIRDRTAKVGIIGLGYVGLPLAIVFAKAGLRVIGIDTDTSKVSRINAGTSFIEDVSDQEIRGLRETGRLVATHDPSVLSDCDAASICVPTPLSKTFDPDTSHIAAATKQIAQYLHPGQVIVLESTSYPGTTREIILPRLEASGLVVGRDYFLAFSPERLDPGRTDWTTTNTPKVLGGVTPQCLDVATTLYEQAIERIVPVSSPEAAEMVKLLENTFRAVNIGLVNEVLLICDKLGLDVWEVLDAAATKPFGYMPFRPGPGLGGHCLPNDPIYLSWKLKSLDYTARFIELASEVNAGMPAYWVHKVQDALNDTGKPLKNSQILVLGVAYKKDVSDLRESPSLDMIHLLRERGALVVYHDPFVLELDYDGLSLRSETDLGTAMDKADCIVVATDHSSYTVVDFSSVSPIVDTRGMLHSSAERHAAADAIRRLG